MRSSYEKIMQLELLSLVTAVFLGLFAIAFTSITLIIISIYLTALSLVCDAFQSMYSMDKQSRFIKQITRALIFIILSTALLFIK